MLVKNKNKIPVAEVIRKNRNTIGIHYNIMDDELEDRLMQEIKLKEAMFEVMVVNVNGPFII